MMHSSFIKNGNNYPVMVVGGGVAGISAALDLAQAGKAVCLIEKSHRIGGQTAKLDKLYPTDHCAFCPLWTDIKRLTEHPLINVYTSASITEIKKTDEHFRVSFALTPPVIDKNRCVFCGKCERECPQKAIRAAGEHIYPPFYMVDQNVCKRCDACEKTCPTKAIAFPRTKETKELIVENIIWACGFKEFDLTPLKEFGFGSHPDIMTSMEFEDWKAEAGINKGDILKKSINLPPKNIAFIQCAGARDQKVLPFCSSVCCMHALKQAKWVKMRNPAIDCVIFYTDLRTVGRDYYEYALQDIQEGGIKLIRGRPSLIYPLPGGQGIAVKFENTQTQQREIWKFDLVVLNGNIHSSLALSAHEGAGIPALTEDGFIDRESDSSRHFACGFSLEPADVAESAIQASAAAVKAIQARGNR